MIRNIFLWGTAAVLALALWGCGDDDSSPDGGVASGEGGSRAEFVQQANAICAEGKTEGLEAMSAYAKENAGSGQSKAELLAEALQKAFLPYVQRQVDEIRDLEAPAGDDEQVEDFLVEMEEAVEASSKGSVSSGAQLGPNFKHSAQLAREYGLSGCAYG